MPNHATKQTLLLVEDSEDDALFFKWTLKKSGMLCSLHHVLDGAEAIKFLGQAAEEDSALLPGTMFLDLKMPVLNGFEVLRWLRSQPFSSRITVIVLSGSDVPSDKNQALELGATEYLVKPIKATELQRYLGEASQATAAATTTGEART